MRVSSLPSLAQVPAATVPLACSCDELQRAQLRLQALASQCSERIERLSQAFDLLPAAASFDAFAVAAPASGQVGEEVDAQAVRRNSRARPSEPASPPPATPGPLLAAGRASSTQLPAGGSRAGAGAQSGTVAPGPGSGDKSGVASLNGWLGSLGQLAALGGEQVALLMQRHATSPPVIGLGAAMAGAEALNGKSGQQASAARRRKSAGMFGAESGAAFSQATQALAGAPGAATSLSPGLAQVMAEAQATARSANRQPSPAWPGGAQPSGLVGAAQLLEQLLAPGLASVVAGAFAGSSQPAVPPRQPATRADSRLVGPLPTVAQGKARAQAPDAPAAGELESPDLGEAVAQQINRLLLDQAWLRGVDLK